MKQYGDITKLNGAELAPVDLIVGGSPCQDLSIAGKRKGLEGARSGLFMEMIRIIKEMRNKTNGVYPRYALFENVPGLFSSNKGADFGAVLGEYARIIEPDSPDVPCPEEGWPKAGVLLVSDGAIAWRTHDAQFWGKAIRDSRTGNVLEMGTPQRRRRIALVMDLRGETAPEILFERKGVSGDIEQSREAQEGFTRTSQDSIGTTGVSLVRDQAVFDPSVHHEYREFDDVSETVRSRYGTGGNNQRLVVATEELAVSVGNGQMDNITMSDKANALDTMHDQQAVMVYGQSPFGNYAENAGSPKASGGDNGGGSENLVCSQYVRRLTPMECERLQGFPDNWTNIPGAADRKRYKALGNSIALPFGLSLPGGLSALVR